MEENSQTRGVSAVTSAFKEGEENTGDQKNREEKVTCPLAEERMCGSRQVLGFRTKELTAQRQMFSLVKGLKA